MSNDKPTSGTFTPIPVGTMVVEPPPDERLFLLTRDKFDLLRSGNISEERQSRDVMLGIFFGSATGFISLGASTDWKPGAGFLLLLVVTLTSGALAFLLDRKCRRAKLAPGYARVTNEIETFFR